MLVFGKIMLVYYIAWNVFFNYSLNENKTGPHWNSHQPATVRIFIERDAAS